MSDLPQILSDERAFIAALESAGSTVRGRMCSCPFHEDRNPSAQWSQGNDGTFRMFCHPCNRHANVLDLQAHTTGRTASDLFREAADASTGNTRPRPTPAQSASKAEAEYRTLENKQAVAAYARSRGTVQSWHPYGPKAAPVLVVARVMQASGKKTFLQFSSLLGGKYAAKNLVERGRIPLYRLAELVPTMRVLIVEGEKCADAAWSVGIPATTSAMGAGKAACSDWSNMRGRTCYLWPDNDDTGRKHMAEVKTILEGVGAKVYLINIDGIGLPAKGDVADFIEALDGKSAQEIADAINGIMDDAAPQSGSGELTGLFEDIAAGKYQAIPWPALERVGSLSKALLPGCITTLCADPGAGKTLLMLQMLAAWIRAGITCALLALEDERRIHLQRILAQICRLSNLTDDDWCRLNAERARDMLAVHRDDIDRIAACIRAEGEDQMTLDEIAAWISDRSAAGARIVVVDPVTAATTAKEPWAADTAFLMKVKKIARTHGNSIVLVTHPRGVAKGAALNAMAGGSAYPRFSHSALWLEKFETQDLRDIAGHIVVCNRSIKITKSRHGRGSGLAIGVMFDHASLRFADVATLAPDELAGRKHSTARPSGKRMDSTPDVAEDAFAAHDDGGPAPARPPAAPQPFANQRPAPTGTVGDRWRDRAADPNSEAS
jgi:hypothetical protein